MIQLYEAFMKLSELAEDHPFIAFVFAVIIGSLIAWATSTMWGC